MSAVARPSPESLICLAKGGDQDALGDLLRTYRDYLKLLARLGIDRRVLQKADASDAVQEVFLQVQRHFDQFQGQSEAELLSWLRQILASCLAKTARRYLGTQRRQVALERDFQDELDHASRVVGSGLVTMSTPSAIAERREEGLQLANGLARLSVNHREVIILRHLEGLSFPEIAGKMNRSVDGVKKLWARALLRLRVACEDSHG